MERVGLGVIGLNLHQGWAGMAHLPALNSLRQFEIRAVATTRQASADETARAVGAAHAFDNNADLIACPDVDLVAVLVNVGQHHAPVMAALAAGKMVYSEWPLGASLAQAQEMAQAAAAAGVRNFIGLQGRSNPPVRYVRDLVAQGYVGEVLSTSIVGSAGAWGAEVTAGSLRSMDVKGGGTMLTISSGHTLDSICAALGELESVSATIANLRPKVRRADTGETIDKTAPDQIAIHGRLKSGAVLSMHYRSGLCRGTNFLWEINGTKGDIVVTRASGQIQYGDAAVRGATGDHKMLRDLPIPVGYFLNGGEPEPPFSIAYAWAAVADDLKNGTRNAPDFAHALRRHRMLDAIQRAADTGQRQTVPG